MTTRHTTMEHTPIGVLTLVAEDDALSGVFMQQHRHLPPAETFGPAVPPDDVLAETARQLTEYFAGERHDFDLPLAQHGTEFQRRVWRGLLDIKYGQTWSYGQLAAHIGSPGSSRAVGLANGRNPISIVVPCHRVVGASGSLTGYGGGIERKAWLLNLERLPVEGASF